MKSGTIAATVGILFLALAALGCESSKKDTNQDHHEETTHAEAGHHDHEHAPAPASREETGTLAPQTTCPVMGGTIDSSISVDYDGKRIYFCCQACVEPFNADPGTYIAKLKELGQKPALLATEGVND